MFNVRTRQMLFSALAAFSMQVASFQMVATASEGQATMPWSEDGASSRWHCGHRATVVTGYRLGPGSIAALVGFGFGS